MAETDTIEDLSDDLDLMRGVTSMLSGSDNSRVKNYKDLADECDIPSELYKSLQPPYADSPTKEVLDDIVGRRPTYSVEELFINLRDMKRLDATKAIGRYFVGKKIQAYLTEYNFFSVNFALLPSGSRNATQQPRCHSRGAPKLFSIPRSKAEVLDHA